MSERQDVTGGCLCGNVRFKISGTPRLVEYCHCNSCRKASGAPVMALAGVALEGFEFSQGDPGCYVSSPGVERSFCSNCGASLTLFIKEFPEEIYVSISVLDDPTAMEPGVHIWRSEKLPWFETADELPRYLQFKFQGLLEESEENT